MIRIIAKLFAVAVALTAFLPVAPLFAANIVTWISSTGSDNNPCTAALPCSTFFQAINAIGAGLNGQINCLNSVGTAASDLFFSASVTVDCAGVYEASQPNEGAFVPDGINQVVKIRNLTISGTLGGWPAIKFIGSGTLIIENCAFENMSGIALDIEPAGPLNLVIKNSRVSNNAAGVLIKPAAGGSVTATFDGVTIINNTGGLKIDSTNGAVRADVSNSTISNNTANGLNLIAPLGMSNLVSLSHDVIASNGQAGIQVSGSSFAVVLVDSTLLDSNATAIVALNSGRVETYGNNRVIGTIGSGFFTLQTLQ